MANAIKLSLMKNEGIGNDNREFVINIKFKSCTVSKADVKYIEDKLLRLLFEIPYSTSVDELKTHIDQLLLFEKKRILGKHFNLFSDLVEKYEYVYLKIEIYDSGYLSTLTVKRDKAIQNN